MPVGTVVAVTEHIAGSELTQAPAVGALWPSTSLWPSVEADPVDPDTTGLFPSGNTTLDILDPDEYDQDGGYVTLVDSDGAAETVAYTFSDDDTLLLSSAPSGTYAQGDMVYLTDSVGTRIVERWADVMEQEGEEVLRCRIPHTLYALLPEGIRSPDNGEQVQFAEDGTDLVITDLLGKVPGFDGVFLDPQTVLGDAIASEQIVGRHILADDIMANKIAALLLIAAQLKTADDGQRVEIDIDGIRWYDSDDNLGINLPTADGQPAIIDANIVAAAIDVTGNATLRGSANSMEIGSLLQLQSSQSDPVVAPSITVNYEELDLTGGDSTQVSGNGLFYASNGGSGGATATYLVTQDTQPGRDVSVAEEYNASTGAFIRTIASTNTIRGILQATVAGSRKIILLIQHGSQWWLYRYSASTLAFEANSEITADIPNTTASASTALGLVGGNPVVVTYQSRSATNASVARLLTYSGSTLELSSTQDLSGRNYTPTQVDGNGFVGLVDDGTSIWVALRGDTAFGNNNHRYNASTFAYEANHDFTSGGALGSRGLTWDGTRFWSRGGGAPLLLKHTTWDWTTESSKYWFAYSWYDGTNETLVSPRASMDLASSVGAILRRARLGITVPTFPGGISHARVYVARNATAPATTALKLQAPTTYVDTDTAVTIYESGFNDSGAAPPISNGFGAGTAALVESQIAGVTRWRLGGDGLFQLPSYTTTQRDAIASPSTGHLVFNFSTKKLNFYDGTAWVAVTST